MYVLQPTLCYWLILIFLFFFHSEICCCATYDIINSFSSLFCLTLKFLPVTQIHTESHYYFAFLTLLWYQIYQNTNSFLLKLYMSERPVVYPWVAQSYLNNQSPLYWLEGGYISKLCFWHIVVWQYFDNIWYYFPSNITSIVCQTCLKTTNI